MQHDRRNDISIDSEGHGKKHPMEESYSQMNRMLVSLRKIDIIVIININDILSYHRCFYHKPC